MKEFFKKKWVSTLGVVILAVIFVGSGLLIFNRVRQERASAAVQELEKEAVTYAEPEASAKPGLFPAAKKEKPAEPAAQVPEEPAKEAPLSVDFDKLLEINPDVKAWLYCEDSVIDFALMQANNNDYYLVHLADRSYNPFGAVFLDYRCAGDFSDVNTVIYGHDMQNGTMFGGLELYREAGYYEDHSVMYLLTPEHSYRLDAVCGFMHTSESAMYALPAAEESFDAILREGMAKSTFASPIVPEKGDRFVTLSTCADDYADARYALILKITEIDE